MRSGSCPAGLYVKQEVAHMLFVLKKVVCHYFAPTYYDSKHIRAFSNSNMWDLST